MPRRAHQRFRNAVIGFTMSPDEPRLQIVSVSPLRFQCSVCGEPIEYGPAPSDVTAQFKNHLRERHPLYYRGNRSGL